MAKEKKDKAKAAPKVKGPRKSGKYKTVKTSQGEVKAAPKKKKESKKIGPSCNQVCRFNKGGGCSLGINFSKLGGSCNFARWGKKMPRRLVAELTC